MNLVLGAEGAFTWLSMLKFLQGDGAEYLPFAHSMLAVVIILVAAWLARISILSAPKGREGLVHLSPFHGDKQG